MCGFSPPALSPPALHLHSADDRYAIGRHPCFNHMPPFCMVSRLEACQNRDFSANERLPGPKDRPALRTLFASLACYHSWSPTLRSRLPAAAEARFSVITRPPTTTRGVCLQWRMGILQPQGGEGWAETPPAQYFSLSRPTPVANAAACRPPTLDLNGFRMGCMPVGGVLLTRVEHCPDARLDGLTC